MNQPNNQNKKNIDLENLEAFLEFSVGYDPKMDWKKVLKEKKEAIAAKAKKTAKKE